MQMLNIWADISSVVLGRIRSPAANNGLNGFKPTAFRVPTDGRSSIADTVSSVVSPLSTILGGIALFEGLNRCKALVLRACTHSNALAFEFPNFSKAPIEDWRSRSRWCSHTSPTYRQRTQLSCRQVEEASRRVLHSVETTTSMKRHGLLFTVSISPTRARQMHLS